MSYHALGDLGLTTSQYDSMEAIAWYFNNTEVKTPGARKLKDEFIIWYDGLDYYDKSFDTDDLDAARERRNAFNLANATSTEEREHVEQVISEGWTEEEMVGRPSRQTSEGTFGDEPPLIDPKYFWIGAGVAALGTYVHWAFVRPWSKASKRIAERVSGA